MKYVDYFDKIITHLSFISKTMTGASKTQGGREDIVCYVRKVQGNLSQHFVIVLNVISHFVMLSIRNMKDNVLNLMYVTDKAQD